MLHSNPSQQVKVGWQGMPFTFIAHAGLPPGYSHTCQTPWSVFLDGSVAPVPSAGADRAALPSARRSPADGHMPPRQPRMTRADKVHRAEARLSRRREAGRKRVSSCRFQALFNSLFKVLCIFPSRYLFAIGLSPVFSFRWNLPPTSSCNPKQPDSTRAHRATANRHGTGFSPSPIPRSKGFERRTRPMAPF